MNRPVAAGLVAFFVSTLQLAALSATQDDPPLSGYVHQSWTHKDGLPGKDVMDIVQTPDGYLWLTTTAGLARFDGVRFASFAVIPGVPPAIGRGLCVGADGTLWIGLDQGGVIGLRNGVATFYPPGNGPIEGTVRKILLAHDNAIWVATSEGASRYQDGRWQTFHLPGVTTYSHAIAEDREGTIAVATNGGRFLKRATDHDFALDPESSGEAYRVGTDPNGLFWDGSKRQGGSLNYYLLKDGRGNVWFTRYRQAGLYWTHDPTEFQRMDTRQRFTSAEGLSNDSVGAYMEDREGSLWIGTLSGLDRLSPSSFRALPLPEEPIGKSTKLLLTAKDGGLLMYGFHLNGYLHVPVGTNTAVPVGNLYSVDSYDPIPGVFVMPRTAFPLAVEAGKQGMLEVRVKGSLRIDDYPELRQTRNERVFKPAYEIPITGEELQREDALGSNVFTRDPSGRIWMAKRTGGLFLKEPGKATPVPELDGKGIDEVACDQSGQLWAGGAAGLFGLVNGQWRKFQSSDGMFQGRVNAFYRGRDGAFWILGTSVGRLKGGHLSSFQSNVPFSNTGSMVEDDDGFTWFSTPAGIYRIAAAEWDKAALDGKYRVQHKCFDERDGLPSLPLGGLGGRFEAARTADGRLWFSLSDGVVSIDPHQIVENRMPPPVIIEGALADEKQVRSDSGLRLPARLHSLRIDYTALSFVVPERVRFRIKLEGFDHDWVDAGGRREAVYTNLEPKRYRFRVMACNNAGVWNEAGAWWEFRVLPAFYQTYWFLALAIGAATSILWALHKLRVRLATQVIRARYEERFAERTRIGRELHDTLLQSLAGTSLQLNAVAKVITTAPQEADQILASVRQQLRVSLREARDKVWELRSPAAERGNFAALLQESLETMTKGIAGFRLEVAGESRSLPGETEEQLLRITQESVTNALRHAEARTVIVQVRFEAQQLVLTVADDGNGFDIDAVTRRNGHWGLKNMQDRAKEIHAQWSIMTSPGHGTKIQAVVPLRERNGK
jgi:signal transduction histidine kinase/ligand-binding sensor domain-containing protein